MLRTEIKNRFLFVSFLLFRFEIDTHVECIIIIIEIKIIEFVRHVECQ